MSFIELALRDGAWTLPEEALGEFQGTGFLRASGRSGAATFLIDPTLDPPIRRVALNEVTVDDAYVAAAVADAWDYRRELAERGRLDLAADAAYRLINGSGDGLPGLAVEIYAGFAFVHLYSGCWRPFLKPLADALLQTSARGVYVTDRTRAGKEGPEGHVAGERAPGDAVTVAEHGLRYAITLAAGPATGLYLDMRENRARVAALSAGRKLLNTFSYTCSFSMAAAFQGAQTTSIDLAKAALNIARQNFAANGIDAQGHRFFAEDVFVFLPKLAKRGETFDVVLLDPPTFARGKKGVFSTERNYADLVAVAAPLVAPRGSLVAFANTHRMDAARWEGEVRKGLGASARDFIVYDRWSQAPDFRVHPQDPAGSYLKSLVLRRNA